MNKFIQKAAHRASSQTQIWPINCSPKHPNEVLSRLGLLLGLGLVSGPSTIQLVDVIFPFQKRTFSQASHGQAAWIPKVLSHPSQAQQKKYLCLFCVVSLFSSIDFVFPVVGLYMVYTRIRCSHVLSLGGTVPLKFLLDVLVLDTNRKNNILHKYIFFMVGKLPLEMFETNIRSPINESITDPMIRKPTFLLALKSQCTLFIRVQGYTISQPTLDEIKKKMNLKENLFPIL